MRSKHQKRAKRKWTGDASDRARHHAAHDPRQMHFPFHGEEDPYAETLNPGQKEARPGE